MASVAATFDARVRGGGKFEANPATRDSTWVKVVVLGVGLSYFVLFLLLPLFAVFAEALRKGFDAYVAALIEPDALSAVQLTLLAAAIAVPLNLVFGLSAAWAIAKFQFPGKNFLITICRSLCRPWSQA
jgi:sulfate transport system permease protein